MFIFSTNFIHFHLLYFVLKKRVGVKKIEGNSHENFNKAQSKHDDQQSKTAISNLSLSHAFFKL